MPKAKYRCLRTVVVDDCFKGTPKETKFVEGRNYPLSDESYARWERRGVFGPVPQKKADKAKAEPDPAPAEDAPPTDGGGDDQAAAGKRAKTASAAPAAGAVMGAAG